MTDKHFECAVRKFFPEVDLTMTTDGYRNILTRNLFDGWKLCLQYQYGEIQSGHKPAADCWCGPELDYVNPETGASVYVHKEMQ